MIKLLQLPTNTTSRNIFKINILALIIATLTSCGSSPEETVENYLDYTFLGNNGKKAYQLLSSDDHMYKSETEFVYETKRKNIFNEKILKKYKDQFSYEILETKPLNQDTMLVKVALRKPNTQNIIHEMISFAMTSSISQMSHEAKNDVMQEQFGKIMNSDELEIETEEKEYLIVRENGEYKIHLNLGHDKKMQLLNEQLSKMETKAEEQKRVIDFTGALKTYRSMLALHKDTYIESEIADLEKIKRNTVQLGKKISLGKLNFLPKKVEVRKVKITKKNWLDEAPKNVLSTENYLVLTFDITNNNEGEVFEFYDANRYKKEHVVYDNYGNMMDEMDLEFDVKTVEDYIHKKLAAGETMEVRAVCEAPLSKKADQFLWKVKLYTDNKKTEDFAYISFTRDQIKFNND
jgi:hypothetical protein